MGSPVQQLVTNWKTKDNLNVRSNYAYSFSNPTKQLWYDQGALYTSNTLTI